MRTELPDAYGNSYGSDAYFKEHPDAVVIAEIDESEPYEVDQTSILADSDGTFILATASGCSCWDGDWSLARYDTVEELLEDIGPTGESDYTYNPSFKGVEDLTRQVEEWKGSLNYSNASA